MSRPRDLSVDSLKGISLLAVILLHFLANLHSPIFRLPYAWIFLNLNLLLRFCVPAFIFLSGYTLSLKYSSNSLRLSSFFYKRFRHIFPLYLFWALFSTFFFQLDPLWKKYAPVFSFSNLLLGGLDYHFYFIPVLISLYCLFPLLFYLFSRWPFISLFISLSLTFSWYFILSLGIKQGSGPFKLLTDQAQYRSLLTWLGYFSAGIFFGLKLQKLKLRSLIYPVIFIFWLLSIVLLLLNAWNLYSLSIDVLDISRFTQPTVFVYSLFTILIYLISMEKNTHTNKLYSALVFMGRQSYVIYLSHTLVIRIIFGFVHHTISPLNLVISCLFLLFAYLLSYLLNRYLVQ